MTARFPVADSATLMWTTAFPADCRPVRTRVQRMQTSCVNFTELRFTSEAALRRYLEEIEVIWTEDIMQQLSKLGLQRKSVMRIWNHQDQFKLGILWEYTSPAAFKECQKVISAHILPHAHKFEMVARLASRRARCRLATRRRGASPYQMKSVAVNEATTADPQ